MTGCVNEYKQKFPAYRKERRRQERLREREEKSMYMQKEVTLNFIFFYRYCNKTRDLAGADAAMWYMMAAMLLTSA